MAVNVSAWVWTLEIPPYEKLVMLELADHADTKGFCFPKQATIAKRCRISRGAVNRIIKRLEAQGLLSQTRVHRGGFQRASEYRLSLGMVIYLSDPALLCDVTEEHISESPCVTHIETSLETSDETSFSGEPHSLSDSKQKETSVKLDELDLKKTKSKETIFENFKPTAKGCGDLWRDCRASASDENGFAGEMTQKQWKQLKDAHDKLKGIDFREVVWKVCADWTRFVKHAEQHFGAFKMGLNPTVDKFYRYRDAAADYSLQNKAVQLTAKPLTNKPASCKPIPKVKQQEVKPYVNPYQPKPKKTAEEKEAIMSKLNKEFE